MSTPIHKGTNQHGTLKTNNTLPICRACGTQYQTTTPLKSCRICDDPRQYVPAAGQKFTTMGELQQSSAGHKLVFKQEEDPKVWAITIEPSVGIGQRAFLIQTEHGNVLWDLVCYLDEKAVEKVCTRFCSSSSLIPLFVQFPLQQESPFTTIPSQSFPKPPTNSPSPLPDKLPRRPLPNNNLPPSLLHNLA